VKAAALVTYEPPCECPEAITAIIDRPKKPLLPQLDASAIKL